MYGGEVESHGSFDGTAHARSPELWISTHRDLVALGFAGTAAFALRRLLR